MARALARPLAWPAVNRAMQRWRAWLWSASSADAAAGFAAAVALLNAGGRGAATGGDPAAWAASIREVTAFFERHPQRTGER